MVRRGVAVRTDLVEAAALLHDVDKAHADGELRRTRGHGAGGAEWLSEQGYPELASAVAHHPVGSLGEAGNYEAWAAATGLEGMVVAYADKRAAQDVVSMDERFERWHRRFPTSEMLVVARERADRLENEICSQAGLAPEDIGRLPWVADALRQSDQ